MANENLNRVFGDRYEITRSTTSQERLDLKKARKVLEDNNLLAGLLYTTASETIRYKEKV
jgi:hypothetical protein